MPRKSIILHLTLFFVSGVLSAIELVVINKTESPLFEVYAVPSDFEGWGYDRLPYDVVLPGEYAVLDLDLETDKPVNFRFVDEDGDLYFKYNLDISSRKKILVSPDDHEVFSGEGLMRFALVNRTGAVVRGLYISSENDEDWGDNLLDEFLLDGDEKTIEIQSSGSFYDIRLELAGESIVKKRVFISHKARVLLTLN